MGCHPGKLNCLLTDVDNDPKNGHEEIHVYNTSSKLIKKSSFSKFHNTKTITLYNLSKPDSQLINKSTLDEILRSFPFPVRHSDNTCDGCGIAENLSSSPSPKMNQIKIIKKFDWSASIPDAREVKSSEKFSKVFRRPSIFKRNKQKTPSKLNKSAFQLMVMKSVETVVPMVVPLEHWLQQRLSSWVQLSGHKGIIIPASEKTLWKKCGKAGDNFEAQAYCKLMNDICQPFVPRFYKEVEYCSESFIEIEDLTRMFDNPAIMDIKLGTRTFLESEVNNPKKRSDLFQKMIQLDPTEPTLKENEEKAITKLRYMQFRERESSSASLGFRIDGIKERHLGELRKDFKKLKDRKELMVVFMRFLNLEKSNIFLTKTVKRLKEIRAVVEKSPFFAGHEVIGSSLLILYDDQSLNIFLIDFAKAIPLALDDDGRKIRIDHRSPWTLFNKEDGYLTGLDNLIEVQRLCAEGFDSFQ